MGTLWLGNIRTLRNAYDRQEAIYVENGIIYEIGAVRDLQIKYQGRIDDIMDVRPYVIYPGLVDSHLHILSLGVQLMRLDFTTARSSVQMKDMIAQAALDTESGQWLLGEGWNENDFSDRKIFHRRELDALAPHNPIALTRVCRHAILANSQALSLAGITKHTPDPPGGVIVRDDKGEPTGLLLEAAQQLLDYAIPALSTRDIESACRNAVNHLLSLGLTGGHTEDLNSYCVFEPAFSVFRQVVNHEYPFKTHLLVHHQAVDAMFEEGYYSGWEDGHLSLGPMKIFSDGAFGGRTALLRQPYNDMPDVTGVAIHKPEELKQMVRTARHYDMPVAIHAIGDQALAYVIDAIESFPCPEGRRDRIIHAQVTPPDLRARLHRLPVILDLQPQFVPSDFPWVIERLGEERLAHAYAWKTLIDDGIACAGGSDAPIEFANPLLGIHAAVTRRKYGEGHAGFYLGQRLSIYEALRLYTYGSQYAIGKEDVRGQIAPGFEADFTILDQDLLDLDDPDSILDTHNMMTVIDGQVAYQRDAFNTDAGTS
ncbi:amidohydrolase [Tuberibacillus sp. Marseille-P3662]|uniref:amidohydrolase n=1 Tax=Tuberibacillus sp. Marseille-P3662 TaxID=1965358 RepID=UPI000A1C8480|nr:amidohydrolase [Tuberibacillus sp. Marseille-P3662]